MTVLPSFLLSDLDWEHPGRPAGGQIRGSHNCDMPPRHSRLQLVHWKATKEWVLLKEVSVRPEEMPCEQPAERVARVLRIMTIASSATPAVPLLRYKAANIEDNRHYAWLLEWCRGGALREALLHHGRDPPDESPINSSTEGLFTGLEEPVCVSVISQVVRALAVLHDRAGVMHGDVSVSNVLLMDSLDHIQRTCEAHAAGGGDDVTVQLGDLDETCDIGTVLPRPTGALVYRPPEWFLRHEDVDDEACHGGEPRPVWVASPAVDVWAVGILAVQMLTGKLHPCLPKVDLFSSEAGRSAWPLMDLLGTSHVPSTSSSKARTDWVDLSPLHLSDAVEELVTRCLAWDPADRPAAADLLNFHWFHNNV